MTQIFDVPDMDCGGCVRSITDAVHKLDAAATVQADLATKRVQITGEGDFLSAIESAGFTVSPAQ
jgi:copper chaperone CopZ